MSTFKLISSTADLGFGDLAFSDLRERLEEDLGKAQTPKDLERLIHSLSALMKGSSYTDNEKHEFRKIRQRAYDKRRNPKPDSMFQKVPNSTPKSFDKSRTVPKPKGESAEEVRKITFDERSWRDRLMLKLVVVIAAILVFWLLLEQTIPLYRAANFADPLFAAFGAIVIMIGFPAFHALSPSRLSLLLCVYVCAYEVGFVGFGTREDETVIERNKVESDATVQWLQERADKARVDYEEVRQRFDNPESKVFKNGWFKAKFVEPAWQRYSETQEKLSTMLVHLRSGVPFLDPILILKITYRLALVFLAMLLVHLSAGFLKDGNLAVCDRFFANKKANKKQTTGEISHDFT